MNTNLNSQVFNIISNGTKVPNFYPQQNSYYANNIQEADEFIKNTDAAKENIQNPDSKKKNKKGKTAAIIGLAIAGVVAGASYLLFKRNFRPANFEENIKFIKASTMDEAKDFAQKHFGVQEFNFGDDIEFANWVNEGLTNINNRFKGKAHMPKILAFTDGIDSTKKEMHSLAITNGFTKSIVFDKKSLAKEKLLKDFLAKTDGLFERTKDGKVVPKTTLVAMDYKKGKELGALWDKADKARKDTSLISRFDLLTGTFKYEDYISICVNPSGVMYEILDNKKIMKIFEDKGVKIDLDAFLKLDTKGQIKYIGKKCNEAKIVRLNLPGSKRGNTQFDILNHEMGHLQHHGARTIFDDFFGRLSDKSCGKFKTDRNSQKIAGKISWYAKEDPKEFVAETFNAMMSNVKVPDDVMDLYKYYKGPVFPNI